MLKRLNTHNNKDSPNLPPTAPSSKTPFARLLRMLLGGFIAIGLGMLLTFGYTSWNQENQDLLENLSIQSGFAAKSSQAVFDNIGTSMELLGLMLEKKGVLRNPEIARPALLQFQSAHPEIAA